MTVTEPRVGADRPDIEVDEYELLATEHVGAEPAPAPARRARNHADEPRAARVRRTRTTLRRAATRSAAVDGPVEEPVEALVVELVDEVVAGPVAAPAAAAAWVDAARDAALTDPVAAIPVEIPEAPSARGTDTGSAVARVRRDAGRLAAKGAVRVAEARVTVRGLVAAMRQAPARPGDPAPVSATAPATMSPATMSPATDAALALDPARRPVDTPDGDAEGEGDAEAGGLRLVDDGPRRQRRNLRVLIGASVLAATALLFLIVGFNVKLAEYQFELDALETRRAQAERLHEDLALEVEAKRSPVRIIPEALRLGLVHATGARPLVADLGSDTTQTKANEATGDGNPTP